jgi:hypothetical protein
MTFLLPTGKHTYVMQNIFTFDKSSVKDSFLTQRVESAATDTLVATARPALRRLENTLKEQEHNTHFGKALFGVYTCVESMEICLLFKIKHKRKLKMIINNLYIYISDLQVRNIQNTK